MKTTYDADKKERNEKIKSALLIGFLLIIVIALVAWINNLQNPADPTVQSTKKAFTNSTTYADTTTVIPAASTTASGATPQDSTSPSKDSTSSAKEDSSDTTKVTETTTAFVGTPKPLTTTEIVDIFNAGTNAVKTDAVKVVRNYENSHIREEYVEMPVFEDMFVDSLKESFTDNTTPIELTTREDIIAKYPISGSTVSSTLTANEIESAKCVENDEQYEITLVLHPSTSPEPGEGVGKAFDVMSNQDVMEGAPEMIKDFSASYVDCSIKCIIDKKTGRAVHSTYCYTVITAMTVDLTIMKVDAQVGVEFEVDFSITY